MSYMQKIDLNRYNYQGGACILELEYNATLFAQIIDLLIIILIFAGIMLLISKVRSFKKNIYNKIATVESGIKEIKVMLEEKKR